MSDKHTSVVPASTGSTVVPAPLVSAARIAAAILQIGAQGGRDSVRLVTVERTRRDGKAVPLAVVPTAAGSAIIRRTGLDLTPQTVAGLVLASRGYLTVTPDGCGVMTAAAAAQRRANAAVRASARKAFGADVRGLLSGLTLSDADIDAALGGISFE